MTDENNEVYNFTELFKKDGELGVLIDSIKEVAAREGVPIAILAVISNDEEGAEMTMLKSQVDKLLPPPFANAEKIMEEGPFIQHLVGDILALNDAAQATAERAMEQMFDQMTKQQQKPEGIKLS